MSQTYDNTNKGVLFLNDRKEQDNHPDRKGSINIDGKEYWLSGWDKQTSKGDTISLSVRAKDASAKTYPKAKTEVQRAVATESQFKNDEIPF